MKCPRKILTLFCTLLLAAASGLPQEPKSGGPTSQDDAQARIRVVTNLVVVPVTVKDSEGHLVVDLSREEFRVLEDDVEQRLEVFSNDPFPLSAVILIDNDLETRVAKQVEPSLPAIAGGFSSDDEAFVARFDQTFQPGKGFTKDPDKLLTELKRTSLQSSPAPAPAGGAMGGGPKINGIPAPGASTIPPSGRILKGQPTKTVDDAVYEAAELLRDRDRERRKIIFLVSDGVNSKLNKNSFDDTVKVLLTAGISVYGVGVGSAYLNRKLTTLSKYAHATGGDVFYAAKREEMEDLYPAVTEEARNQYTLAYVPRGTDPTAEHHSIEVRIKRPGLTIHTRDGYYTGRP